MDVSLASITNTVIIHRRKCQLKAFTTSQSPMNSPDAGLPADRQAAISDLLVFWFVERFWSVQSFFLTGFRHRFVDLVDLALEAIGQWLSVLRVRGVSGRFVRGFLEGLKATEAAGGSDASLNGFSHLGIDPRH